MRLIAIAAVLLASIGRASGEVPPLSKMSAPPSVALNPTPFDASSDVKLDVNVIPADAKYVIHLRLSANGAQITPDQAAAAGAGLSHAFEQLPKLAQDRGANLIVVLGVEHGVDVPIQQLTQPLRVRGEDPTLVLILFRREKATPPTAAETALRFTTHVPSSAGNNLHYNIALQSSPPGLEMATWAYGNISRFVADAVQHGFNTVAVKSTTDPKFEAVWLPGCDEPVRVSLTAPELDVTIFKRDQSK